MLELENVSKRFGEHSALLDVSLRVERARSCVLIGQSGAGKSSVLRAITGLLWPDSGRVLVDGTEVTRASMQALRQRLGYVIQEGGLFPHLTGRQNAALMARHIGWPDARIAARIEELARLTRLPLDTLERFPRELSGGQRQRIGLIRALMLDPAVLLLDEPLAALDPITRAELQTDLREIFGELAKTVLMVTHDLGEAAFFGDSLALMRDGAIIQQGSLADLVERPADAFVSRFVNAQRAPLPRSGEPGE